MPRTLDLIDGATGDLDPSPQIRLWGVMLYPEDRSKRQRRIETIREQCASGERSEVPDQAAVSLGTIAGRILWDRVCAYRVGRSSTLTSAIEPLLEELSGGYRSDPETFERLDGTIIHAGHRNRQSLFAAWDQYHNVSHYWCAHLWNESWDSDLESLPEFLRSASQIAGEALNATSSGRRILNPKTTWRLKLPARFANLSRRDI
jgi:hypothetical protein